MADSKLDLLQGTLDLMVLQTLETLGSLHGYGIARRIEQVSEDQILLNQGTIYASLVRLQQRGWISAAWEFRITTVKPSTTPYKGRKAPSPSGEIQLGKACGRYGRVLAATGTGGHQ